MPQTFRLAISPQNIQRSPSIGDGVASAARAFSMAPLYAQQAAEEARDSQARRGLIDAQRQRTEAETALFGQKLQDAETQRERGSIGGMLQTGMLQFKVPLHQQKDFGQYLQTGQLPAQYKPGVDDTGPYLPTPKMYEDDTGAKILQSLGMLNKAMTLGDGSISNLANAEGAYQDQGFADEAAAAARAGDDMAMSRFNSIRGKKEFTPFAAVGETGTALNQVTGEQEVSNDAMRAIFGDKAAADLRAKDAQAAASYASADSSRATAQKTRQAMDPNSGPAVIDAGGPAQVVLTRQYGKAPPGYRWKPDGTAEAIPGGPADIKAGAEGAKAQGRADAAALAANNVLSAVKDAKNLVGNFTVGPGSILANVPGLDARDLRAKLDTIKANLGFDRLQQMREMSPTGGALGAVAVQELIALQSTVASLDQGQSPTELTKSLEKIEMHYNRWLQAVNSQAPNRQSGATGSWGQPAAGGPKPGTVEDGFQFIGGDPADPKNWRRVQ